MTNKYLWAGRSKLATKGAAIPYPKVLPIYMCIIYILRYRHIDTDICDLHTRVCAIFWAKQEFGHSAQQVGREP